MEPQISVNVPKLLFAFKSKWTYIDDLRFVGYLESVSRLCDISRRVGFT